MFIFSVFSVLEDVSYFVMCAIFGRVKDDDDGSNDSLISRAL